MESAVSLSKPGATIGQMDQRITLQRRVATADGGGGETYAWADLPHNATVWAHVVAKAGRESLTEGRVSASFTVLFHIHNRRDVDVRDRIVWQGVTYNIRGIRDEGGRSLRLTLEAERGVAD
jgi:SPP1 family predicted phage head-tail adaptor